MRTLKNALPSKAKKSHIVAIYDTPGELAATVRASTHQGVKDTAAEMLGSKRGDFFHGQTLPEALDRMVSGDESAASEARKLSQKIARAQTNAKKSVRRASMVGGRVSVPAYLAGLPNPMRKTVKVTNKAAPLSIVINVTSSGIIDASDLFKRGIACAAMAQKLATLRPVDLYLAMTGKPSGWKNSTIVLVKFPTRPLDLTRLAYLISNQGFARGVAFSAFYHVACEEEPKLADKRAGMIDWPFSSHAYIGGANAKEGVATIGDDLRAVLKQDILYIPGAFVGSADHKAIQTSAIEWVNDTIKAHS